MGIFVTGAKADLNFGQATLRHFGKLLCYATFGLGFLLPLLRSNRPALHDWFAGSVVLVRPGEEKLSASAKVINSVCILGLTVIAWYIIIKVNTVLSSFGG